MFVCGESFLVFPHDFQAGAGGLAVALEFWNLVLAAVWQQQVHALCLTCALSSNVTEFAVVYVSSMSRAAVDDTFLNAVPCSSVMRPLIHWCQHQLWAVHLWWSLSAIEPFFHKTLIQSCWFRNLTIPNYKRFWFITTLLKHSVDVSCQISDLFILTCRNIVLIIRGHLAKIWVSWFL